ncbi:hypothetical protein [Planctellipticum variicoloris]|uniref:hypothetical protein n=1 Tax=Planctellipticum variicoloris TaxID=3064265 RepID=UPI003013D659|nr:hypothetical protein SH412_004205 [Planctomycetaceae bacterium SH412]
MWRKYQRRRRDSWVRRVEILVAGVFLVSIAWGLTALLGTQDVSLWARSMLPSEQRQQVTTHYRGGDAKPAEPAGDSIENAHAPFPFLVTVDVNQEVVPGLARRTRLSVVWFFGMTFQVDSRRL